MSIPWIDIYEVKGFNDAAQVLETVVIGGRKFEMIHDYWHQHPRVNYTSSVMVRSRGELFTHNGSPFRRNSKNDKAYLAWAKAAALKYLKD